jgi:hypothetical protein
MNNCKLPLLRITQNVCPINKPVKPFQVIKLSKLWHDSENARVTNARSRFFRESQAKISTECENENDYYARMAERHARKN